MKAFVHILLLLPLLLKFCSGTETSVDSVPLAKVGNQIIYQEEALYGMPSGLSKTDSIAYVKQFLQNRIKDLLMYERALAENSNIDDLDQLVEDYRRSLIIHSYQQALMNKQMQKSITDTVLQVFYENNRDRFQTGHDLVKGVFIKVPKSAVGIDKLKKIYTKTTDDAFQQIETFCIQNAGQVEYFYDHWVLFVDLLSNASYEISNTADFLRSHSTLDVVVGDYQYLMHIQDYVLAGTAAPFEYVKDEVKTVVTNTRKTEFLHQYEENLYKDATKKGAIIFYDVNQKKTK